MKKKEMTITLYHAAPFASHTIMFKMVITCRSKEKRNIVRAKEGGLVLLTNECLKNLKETFHN